MGVTFTETIVQIWNRIIEKCRRKRHATKKGKQRKNICQKPKNGAKSRKAKKASSCNSVQCEKKDAS